MSVCRTQTQNLIHQHFLEPPYNTNTDDHSGPQGYIQKFGLHHIMHLKGVEGVLETCLSVEYMARYIRLWASTVQPIKVLRTIGMNKYTFKLRKTIAKTQWSTTSIHSFLDILYSILMWEELIDETVLLSEQWNRISLTLDMPAQLQIRHHQILGLLYRKINQFDKGLHHLERTIELGKEHNLSKTLDCIASRNEMAVLLDRIGKLKDGFDLMKEVHEDSKVHLGPEEEQTIISQRFLAWFAFQLGKLDEATQQYLDVLDIMNRKFGKSHYRYVSTMVEYADLLQTKGEWKRAYDICQEARNVIRMDLGMRSMPYIQVSNTLGLIAMNLNFYDEAKNIFQELIEQAEVRAVPVPMYHVNISVIYMWLKDIPSAEAHMTQANILAQEHWAPNCRDFITLKQNFARLRMHQEKFQEAIDLTLEVLRLQRAEFGEEHFHVTYSYASLAYLYEQIENETTSYEYQCKTYQTGCISLSKGHQFVSDALQEIAWYHINQDDLNKAEAWLRDGCDTVLNEQEPANSSNLYSIFLLGRVLLTLQKNQESLETFQCLLPLEEQFYGKDNTDLVSTHNYLAKCHVALKSFDKALSHRQRAFDLLFDHHGLAHTKTIEMGLDLVQDHRRLNQHDSATSLLNSLQEAYQLLENPDTELAERLLQASSQ